MVAGDFGDGPAEPIDRSDNMPDGDNMPLMRLRYGGSAARWGFAVYLASKAGSPGGGAALSAGAADVGQGFASAGGGELIHRMNQGDVSACWRRDSETVAKTHSTDLHELSATTWSRNTLGQRSITKTE